MTKTKASSTKTATARRRDRRDERYTHREQLRSVSSIKRIRSCGTPIGVSEVGVKVSGTGSKAIAGFTGLESCGSVWACPVCAAKVASVRQNDIQQVVLGHMENGGSVAMLTMTMRHNKGQKLADLWDGISAAWKAATNGAGWRADRDTFNVDGYVRTVEVTHGQNGWHVHVHALLLGQGYTDLMALKSRMWNRWQASLTKNGFAKPDENVGSEIHYIEGKKNASKALAEYFTKAGFSEKDESTDYGQVQADAKAVNKITLEAARSDLKQGKWGNRTPWGILADVFKHGDAADMKLWHEYEKASRGRRQVTWSRGLRSEHGLDEKQQTDEEISEQDYQGELIGMIDAVSYRKLCRVHPWIPGKILRAAEQSGKSGVNAVLRAVGAVGLIPPPPSLE